MPKVGRKGAKVAAKHIQVAQTQGPKAGFNAYMETLRRSGLPTAQAVLDEFESQGNKKAQFEYYCAKFGTKFGSTPSSVDEHDDLAQQVRVLQARLAELSEQGIGVVATEVDDEDEIDTSLDDVDDGWTEQDTEAENVVGRSLLQKALGRSTPKPKKAPAKKQAESKENLWRPWAITRFGIPMQVGGTFTYVSKRAKTNTVHQVTRITPDGVYAKRIK